MQPLHALPHLHRRHGLCDMCSDATRDAQQLCVVETPADQAALERTGSYRGLYFVLMGRISPLDGIGVADIGAAGCSSAPPTAS